MNAWKEPKDAFEQAIEQGRLSRDPLAENYAGEFMYMGPTHDGRYAFKSILTRQYLPLMVVAL